MPRSSQGAQGGLRMKEFAQGAQTLSRPDVRQVMNRQQHNGEVQSRSLPVHAVFVARQFLLAGPVLLVPADIARDIGTRGLRGERLWLPRFKLDGLPAWA